MEVQRHLGGGRAVGWWVWLQSFIEAFSTACDGNVELQAFLSQVQTVVVEHLRIATQLRKNVGPAVRTRDA